MAQLAVIVMCRLGRPPPVPTHRPLSSATKWPWAQKLDFVSRHISCQFGETAFIKPLTRVARRLNESRHCLPSTDSIRPKRESLREARTVRITRFFPRSPAATTSSISDHWHAGLVPANLSDPECTGRDSLKSNLVRAIARRMQANEEEKGLQTLASKFS